jgi:hypothetical protein
VLKIIIDDITNELKNNSSGVSAHEKPCMKPAIIPADIITTANNMMKIKSRNDNSRNRREKSLFASLKKEERLNLYCILMAEFLNTPRVPPSEYRIMVDASIK